MNESKLRAWWFHRQGLDGSLAKAAPEDVLERAGWARSVGGVGPYITLFARAGTSRAAADAAVERTKIHELPAARGCTYVLPASEFALGLTVAQSSGEADLRIATKLGVSNKEIETLCEQVADALDDGPLDPDGIKQAVGASVRNLGDEGRKKGLTTTLPVALGLLQTRGEIRRVPVDGRLDQQRYKYARWSPGPLEESRLTEAKAFSELASRFFKWVGPATMKEFQWFSGLGVKDAKDAVESLSLVPAEAGSDRLLLPEDEHAFVRYLAPRTAHYALVSSLDSISVTRRDVMTLVAAADRDMVAGIDLGDRGSRNISDLAAHAILDRGRLIGYWEYDPDAQRIVWALFTGRKDKALEQKVAEMETFVREQLGDARSFSLDSPRSRRPKLDALAKLT